MTIDVNLLRTAVMLLSFGVFVGIWRWAWSRRSAAGFDEAARLPLDDAAEEPSADAGSRALGALGTPRGAVSASDQGVSA
jgi:cytochrome c oxidase cbb3-type subunit 4